MTERDTDLYITALENDVGVRSGFFDDLLKEKDDWSFIIKVHALVEAAVSHLLTEVAGHDKLLHLFAQLELSNARTGKIAFAKALECLDESERHTIRKLSELRNDLVHDVSNVDFNFERWSVGLDANQAKQFATAFGPTGDSVTVGSTQVPSITFFKDNPKINIWFACLFLLSLIYQRKDLAKIRRELDRRRQDLTDSLLSHNLPPPPQVAG